MALIVEDGTGGDALITLAFFKDYCLKQGLDLGSATDPEQEAAIRRASTYLTTGYTYKGLRYGGRNQIQAWPRSDVVDVEGWSIPPREIPREVQAAAAEAAFYEVENPNGLNPSVVMNDRVIEETVGPISTRYADPGSSVGSSRPVLTILTDLLGPLLASNNYGGVTARADRG